MCGITSNSQDGGENDGKINDLKLRDSTRATMVSRCGRKTVCMAQQYA